MVTNWFSFFVMIWNHPNRLTIDLKSKSQFKKTISIHDLKSFDFKSYPTLAMCTYDCRCDQASPGSSRHYRVYRTWWHPGLHSQMTPHSLDHTLHQPATTESAAVRVHFLARTQMNTKNEYGCVKEGTSSRPICHISEILDTDLSIHFAIYVAEPSR